MVENKRRAEPLMAPVTWTPEQAESEVELPPVALRYAKASTVVRQHFNDYALALHDLGIVMDDAMVERMLDAAEKRECDAAAEDGQRLDLIVTRQPATHRSVVYYMRMDRLVKIGISTDLRTRTGSIMAQGVMAIEWGDRQLERQRHNQFVDQHSHLEWFRLEAPLVEHIAELRVQWARDEGMTVERWLGDLGVRGCD